MRIAFIGLGSIAKRHIRNLSEVLREREIEFYIDVYRHEGRAIEDDEIRRWVSGVYTEQELKNHNYDIIFITNPTALHFQTIKKCIGNTTHMFIEKPIFSDVNADWESLNLIKDSVYYVACPLRYTSVLQYIKNHIDFASIYSVRAISTSYMPEWRPGLDYRQTYSANKKLGGGVSIDLVHEWDYLTFLFGFPSKVLYVGGKYSNLEIDSEDLAVYVGVYQDKMIELHLDYFGRKNMREMLIFAENDTIRVDFINGRVIYEKDSQVIDLREERDAYQKRELEHFLDIIDGKSNNDNDVQNAIRVLKLTQGH